MKLLVADDHTLFRDALVQYIERSDPTSSVTLAKDFFQAIEILEQNPTQDLVILDMRMPGMNGLQGFRVMKEKFPDQPVALMSGVAEASDVQEALEYGAVGYFPKTMSGKALLQAIKAVLDGEVFVPEGKKSNVFMPSYYADAPREDTTTEASLENEGIRFTPRELEVLSYLVDGASNKEIASALDLQIVTVKLHVRGVCRKLDAKNRTQAALKARELGVQPVSTGA